MDQKTRKLMTMHKALDRRNDRLYALRKGGGRGHASFEDWTDTPIQRLKNHIKKKQGKTNNRISNISTDRKAKTRKQKCEEKQVYGYFKRKTGEICHEQA